MYDEICIFIWLKMKLKKNINMNMKNIYFDKNGLIEHVILFIKKLKIANSCT